MGKPDTPYTKKAGNGKILATNHAEHIPPITSYDKKDPDKYKLSGNIFDMS
ncbi:hypothetical protein ACR9GP_23470 [Enterobacter ludwigii]